MTGRPLWVRPAAAVPAATRIRFSPRRLRVPAGGTGTFAITIDSRAPLGSQQFASIRFVTARGTARIPVGFVRRPGAVRLDQSCGSDSVLPGRSTWCTVTASNTGHQAQDVSLSTSTNRRLRAVAAGGASISGGRRPVVSLSRTLAGAELGVPSVGPGQSPGPGFLDLADFGAAPQPIGDEEQQVYDTPSFRYNGQTYSSVSVDSNGYLVVGGAGSADDNECCTIPGGASPAAPNNLLAPFWTDLDGGEAAGIRAISLQAGTDVWTVIQWDVTVFGTKDLRRFQVWIGASDDGDDTQDISFTYDGAMADPAGQPFLVGAENEAGQGDMVATLPDGEDRVVTSSDPVPGDTVSYRVRATGVTPGTGVVHTDMDTSQTRGTTTADTEVRVRRRPPQAPTEE